ncbi:ubiquinol-cytochrome-c reductase complex assembly factor 1 isoform X2 [Phyllopteryx taeniolatus]|uniref:ubiquinol-cytochrome-c reductase complex assembly factor 1 isoform X2 n=1 Tax=Phyllopteryx taeniolatus TaxID=161469 RepID=UPI002AD565DB|nr:ubiquinol-cytochrome-c reductase complex assembly factor 1 isoform X2 [Phyllopteryx taeniolatus]
MWATWLASRRPLQSAVRRVGTVRRVRTDLFNHKVSQQVSAISSPCAVHLTTTCQRTLHLGTQVHNVKETPAPTEEEVGGFTKLIEAMGFTGPLKYNKWKIKIAALRMYTCCVERISYDDFFNRCSLPDTLNSWFLVAQLHVWMCLVRMRQEGRAGKYMCRYIVHSMWEDVEQRSKIMGLSSYPLCGLVAQFLQPSRRQKTGVMLTAACFTEGMLLARSKDVTGAFWQIPSGLPCAF